MIVLGLPAEESLSIGLAARALTQVYDFPSYTDGRDFFDPGLEFRYTNRKRIYGYSLGLNLYYPLALARTTTVSGTSYSWVRELQDFRLLHGSIGILRSWNWNRFELEVQLQLELGYHNIVQSFHTMEQFLLGIGPQMSVQWYLGEMETSYFYINGGYSWFQLLSSQELDREYLKYSGQEKISLGWGFKIP